VPADVNAADWSILAHSSSSADAIGSAVSRIITSIAARLSLESPASSMLYDSALPNFSVSTASKCFTPSDGHDVSID